MALIQFTKVVKDGAAAVVVGAKVFIKYHGSNAKAPVFSDAGGTTALAQPLTSIAGGVVTFYARDDRSYRAEAFNAGQTALIAAGPIASGPGTFA